MADQNLQLFVKIVMLFYLLTSRKLGRSVASFLSMCLFINYVFFYHQQTVKRNDETHEFCTQDILLSSFYMLTCFGFLPQIDSACSLASCVLTFL